MSKLIQSKSRLPESLQYNAWAPLSFQPSTLVGTSTALLIHGQIPLGLNYKITHVSYVLSDFSTAAPAGGLFTAGKLGLNIVSGVSSYEGAAAASSYGYLTLSGAFAAGDKITVVIASIPYTYVVSARDTSLQLVAAAMTSFLNLQSLNNQFAGFNTLYRANSLGAEIVIQTLAYSTATPTFAVSVVTSATGAAVVGSGATMVAGVAGALPVNPVSDTTNLGIVPSQVAAVGSALFPVDIVLPVFAAGQSDVVGTVYALENFDANWPTLSELTLRYTTDGTVAGNLVVTLWGVPNDIHPMQPEEAATAFHLTQIIL